MFTSVNGGLSNKTESCAKFLHVALSAVFIGTFFDFLVLNVGPPWNIGNFYALLTLFDMGGMASPSKNVFDHCAETLWSRKL